MDWQWTDLMVGDKIKFTKEMVAYWNTAKNNKDGIFEINKIEIESERIYIYANWNWIQIYINYDGTWQGIRMFDIVELAKD
jgi:hypothetical protein